MSTRNFILSLLFLITLPGLGVANEFYTHGSFPTTGSAATSAGMRAELDAITAGFNLLPAMGGNNGRAVVVNSGGSGLTTTTGQLSLAGNFTISGAYATTFTVTGATTVTFPTTGTLSTLAGAESLSNKTLVNPTFSGTGSGSLTGLSLTTPAISGGSMSGSISSTATVTGETLSNANLTGTTTNSGTISGGTISAAGLSGSSNTFTNISLTSAVTGILPPANGGTGSSGVPTDGQIPIGNGSVFTPATLTPSGTGTTIMNGAGSITIFAEGFSTGDVKLTIKTVADSGWVLMNDGSIGSASSGATTRANADTQSLYTLIWTNVADTWAPVIGGRGASASADFSANKPITLPRTLGRALAGYGTGATVETVTSQTASGNAVPVLSNNTKWITGMFVTLSNVSGFTGLSNGTYYVVRASSTSVQFASSLANAQNGTVLTVTGTGSFTMTYTFTTRALGEIAGEEAHAQSSTELLAHSHSFANSGGGGGNSSASAPGADSGTETGVMSTKGGNAAMNIMQPTSFFNVMMKL